MKGMTLVESIKAIKNRIQSIVSTRQITQSMRLVSTAKVQRVRSRMNANQPFREQAEALIDTVIRYMDGEKHPFISGNSSKEAAILVISADRGLCGGYNVNAGRAAAELVTKLGRARFVTVGSKARDYCRRRIKANISRSFEGISENPFFEDATEIADMLIDWYKSGEIGSVYMIYTQFKNMLTQEVITTQLLPLGDRKQEREGVRVNGFEPGAGSFLEHTVPFYLASSIYGAILEASSCEQSARVTSMDSAVKNSDEMISRLSLQYNQARQGRITQEIIEITGGADAVQ